MIGILALTLLAARKRRLLDVTIVGGTMAAAFTTGPAVGGLGFTAWLMMTLGLENPSWRLLCGAAQLSKPQNVEEHLARAQSCRARLEAIEVGLSTGYLDVSKATAEFLRCVEDASFIQAKA